MPERFNPTVAIVDIGIGNLFSIQQACTVSGLAAVITSDKNKILSANAVILPGVGAFGDAMQNLGKLDLISPLRDAPSQGRFLIGVCLGLQLLMEESEEFGNHKGLGLIKGTVRRFESDNAEHKIPQIGWNRIHTRKPWNNTALADIVDEAWMYFVHSYYVAPDDPEVVLAESHYSNTSYCAALSKGYIHAFQFHPERSAASGLKIYANLRKMICAGMERAELSCSD